MNNVNISKRDGKIFIISDTHWWHPLMSKVCERPSNFSQLIINQWRSIVQPKDTVIHLGDVIWGNKQKLISIMNQLTGTVILIRGNHDKSHSDNWFKDAGFSFVCQKVMINNILLSHMPSILTKEDIEFGVKNVHGHFHNIKFEKWEKNLVKRLTDSHYLLALEMVGYKPVLLSKVFEKNLVIQSNKIKRSIRNKKLKVNINEQ